MISLWPYVRQEPYIEIYTGCRVVFSCPVKHLLVQCRTTGWQKVNSGSRNSFIGKEARSAEGKNIWFGKSGLSTWGSAEGIETEVCFIQSAWVSWRRRRKCTVNKRFLNIFGHFFIYSVRDVLPLAMKRKNLPTIYFVTPTHYRPTQKADLTRLSQTLGVFNW